MSKKVIIIIFIWIGVAVLSYFAYQQSVLHKSNNRDEIVISDHETAVESVSPPESQLQTEAVDLEKDVTLLDIFAASLGEMLKEIKTYNHETGDSYSIEVVQAMNQIEFEMMILFNQLTKAEEGKYAETLPEYTLGDRNSDKPITAQFYYEVNAKGDAYTLCRYSLIETTRTVPFCATNSEALDFLKYRNLTTEHLESRKTLLKYYNHLDQYVKEFLALSPNGTYTPLTSINVRNFSGTPSVSAYLALNEKLFTSFNDTVRQTFEFDADISEKPKSLDTYVKSWTNSYVTHQLFNLLIAYNDEHSSFPININDLFPKGYDYTGAYTPQPDLQDFKLCDTYSYPQISDNWPDETEIKCFDRHKALQQFINSQMAVDTVNNIYINAITNTYKELVVGMREDINIHLGLITIQNDFRAFEAAYGRLPKNIDEFYNEYTDHYKKMVDSGFLKLSGTYNEGTNSFDVIYQVIDRPWHTVSMPYVSS